MPDSAAANQHLASDQALCSVNSCIQELTLRINNLVDLHSLDIQHLRVQNVELKEQHLKLTEKLFSCTGETGISSLVSSNCSGRLPGELCPLSQDDGEKIPLEVYHRYPPYPGDFLVDRISASSSAPVASRSSDIGSRMTSKLSDTGSMGNSKSSDTASRRTSNSKPEDERTLSYSTEDTNPGCSTLRISLPSYTLADANPRSSAFQSCLPSYTVVDSNPRPSALASSSAGKKKSLSRRTVTLEEISEITPVIKEEEDEYESDDPWRLQSKTCSQSQACTAVSSTVLNSYAPHMYEGSFELCEILRYDYALSHTDTSHVQPTMTWMNEYENNTAAASKIFDECKSYTKSGMCLLHPTSVYRMIWECSGAFLLVCDILIIPMMVFTIPRSLFFDTLQWVTMLYWTCDMFFSCISGFYTNEGTLVMDRRTILLRYAKSWFILDLIIVGVDWFPIVMGLAATGNVSVDNDTSDQTTIIRITKVMRMFRFVRLLRIMKLTQSNFVMILQERMTSIEMYVFTNLSKNIVLIIILNHFCACGWYGVGSADIKGQSSWVKHYGVDSRTWLYGYLTSFHWSMAQFANGEILIEPQNVYERCTSIFVLLLSMLVFSSFLAIVGNTVHQLMTQKSSQTRDQYILRLYLRQNLISLDVRMRVNRYVNVKLLDKSNIKQSDVKLFDILSRPLQTELYTEMYLSTLTSHQFFDLLSRVSSSIVRGFCVSATRRVPLSSGDTLFSFGEDTACMYFMENGAMYYTAHGNHREITRGDSFCEAALWAERWLTVGRMSAVTECEMLALDRSAIREVMARYHTTNMKLPREYAMAFISALNQAYREGCLSDVQSDLVKSRLVQKVLYRFNLSMSRHDLDSKSKSTRRLAGIRHSSIGSVARMWPSSGRFGRGMR